MEKNLTSSESLAFITEMVSRAKRESSGEGSNLGQYALQKLIVDRPYLVWLVLVPIVILSVRWSYLLAIGAIIAFQLLVVEQHLVAATAIIPGSWVLSEKQLP